MTHVCLQVSLTRVYSFLTRLTLDRFEKVVCVAAAKVPVVKIWDADLYFPQWTL